MRGVVGRDGSGFLTPRREAGPEGSDPFMEFSLHTFTLLLLSLTTPKSLNEIFGTHASLQSGHFRR